MAGKRVRRTSSSSKDQTEKTPLFTKPGLLRLAKRVGIFSLVAFLLMALTFVILYRSIDIPDPNKDFTTETSFVYYADGKQELGKFATQNRVPIGIDEMPDNVKNAVIAIENQSFYTDKGISPTGIIRAAFNNAKGGSTQGASTITQQYVKILYLSQERSLTRKVKEAILSLKVQRTLSKDEVLEGYLNTIYFGHGAYGIEAAAGAYFEKQAKDLSLREAAVLASVLNNPTSFDPDGGKDARLRLKSRYEQVLSNMADLEMVTDEAASQASRRLPKFPKIEADNSLGGQKGHVLTMVKAELARLGYTPEEIEGGGLKVTTTFTEKAMGAAQAGVESQRPDGFGDKELHVGVASIEPGTGAIRGIYGGQDYLQSQINWAVAGGQAGSTFKPFALAAAIKQGYELRDTFDGNSPYLLPDGNDVENQGDQDYGSSVNMLTATKDSINTAFIDMTLGMDNGPEAIVETANAMGIPPEKQKKKPFIGYPNKTPGLQPNTGVALGSQTVSPINMASGYATIDNDGVYTQPYIIEKVRSPTGHNYNHTVKTERAITEGIARDVSYAMEGVVSSGGSGYRALNLGRPAAGKTGTATNTAGDVTSAWFVGYTPQLVTAVMYVRGNGVGKLDGWLPEFFGGTYPTMTWTAIMQANMEGLDVEDFPEPEYVTGTAPQDGHAPIPTQTYTPPPPRQPTKKPTKKNTFPEPTETEPPPTSEPPPPSTPPPPPTSTPCSILGNCPPPPATTPPPPAETQPPPSGGPA